VTPATGYQRPVLIEDTDVLGQVKSNRMTFIKSIRHKTPGEKTTVIKIDRKLRLWPWIIVASIITAYLVYILWLKDQ
jgi:hypothetical protein